MNCVCQDHSDLIHKQIVKKSAVSLNHNIITQLISVPNAVNRDSAAAA